MRKRLRAPVAVLLALAFVAAGCGGDDDDDAATTTAAGGAATTATTAGGGSAGSDVSVGLLYDITGRGDKSFNDAAAAGLDQAKDEYGIKTSESTPSGDNDRAERITQLVDEGNDLIIGVGFLWGDQVTASAEANPETSYAIVDSVVDAPNVASLVFAANEGSFLVGVAAALKSKSGKIGFIGGVENQLIQSFEAGYVAGAKAANPAITVDVKYISQPPDFTGFNNSAVGKSLATAMYGSGIDVVFQAAGASGTGVFEAAKESGAPGSVWAIGVDSDQYNTVSADLQPYILTSMLKKVDVAVYETISAFADGGFEPTVTTFDLASDGVGYSTSGGFVKDISTKLDDYKKQIIDGKIKVPDTP